MRRHLLAAALVSVALCSAADARPRHHVHYRQRALQPGQPGECRGIPWCGCWLRLYLRVSDPARKLDRAAAWYGIGRRVAACQVKAIAVWPHHVGQVTACLGGGLMQMISGNDGHAVRDRVRPIAGAQFRVLN